MRSIKSWKKPFQQNWEANCCLKLGYKEFVKQYRFTYTPCVLTKKGVHHLKYEWKINKHIWHHSEENHSKTMSNYCLLRKTKTPGLFWSCKFKSTHKMHFGILSWNFREILCNEFSFRNLFYCKSALTKISWNSSM